jgi:hypothetical protein
LHRRLLIITLVVWLPLLLFAALLQDVEVHVRFLIALVILVAAELIVHAYHQSQVLKA